MTRTRTHARIRTGRALAVVVAAAAVTWAPALSATAEPIDPRTPSGDTLPEGQPRWLCRWMPGHCVSS